MTAAKNPKIEQGASYKLAAALRRSKLAATSVRLEQEVLPVGGRIRIVLSGKSIPRKEQESRFGPSAINIPEFAQARKKQK